MAPAREGGGRGELCGAVEGRERGLDPLGVDPRRFEARANALHAPAVQRPAILDQQPGVAGVIERALADERRDRLLDGGGRVARAVKARAQLRDAVFAAPQVAVGEGERIGRHLGGGRCAGRAAGRRRVVRHVLRALPGAVRHPARR